MNYCERCMVPTEEDCCPVCGERKLWPILPEDPCFVAELSVPWSDMFSDILKQEGIPCLGRPVWGAGWTTVLGSKFERIRFYVPYDRLPSARGLAEELFSQMGEDPEETER